MVFALGLLSDEASISAVTSTLLCDTSNIDRRCSVMLGDELDEKDFIVINLLKRNVKYLL